MNTPILSWFAAMALMSGGADAPKLPFATPLQWKSTGVLIHPISDETHNLVSIKDPLRV